MLCTMLRFLCKRLLLIHFETHRCSAVHSFQSLKFISTNTSSCTTQNASFTLNDLIESCRLSQRLLSRVKSQKRANLVIKFLQSSGFSRTQVEGIVSKRPEILNRDPLKILKPKIYFFRSLGMLESDVTNIFFNCPSLLARSLKDHLIPSFDLLRTFLGEQHAISGIKGYPCIILYDVVNNLVPNLLSLRNNGVPDSQILKMINNLVLIRVPGSTKPNWFDKILSAVIEIGFNPHETSFIYAICSMGLNGASGWEEKLRLFGSLGFSKEEILSMFRKHPLVMGMSGKRTTKTVEFYVKKFEWSPSQLSLRPTILSYSLEKRVTPRCSVLQVLVSRNQIQKSMTLCPLLAMTDKKFFGRFVNEYMDKIPEVLDAYRGKLEFDKYNFASGKTEDSLPLIRV